MSAPDDHDEDRMLAAEYALGLLTPAEARAFEEVLSLDPELRAEYARWEEDFVGLTQDIAPAPPPPGLFAAIESRLFPEEKQRWWQRLGLVPALLGGLVAALLVLFVNNQGIVTPPPDVTGLGAQIAAADQGLIVLARVDPEDAVLVLDRQAGAVASGRVQELWLIVGDAAPVSLGVLAESGETRLPLTPELLAVLGGGVLAISDEPPGGSPTGAPTGAVLATGEMKQL